MPANKKRRPAPLKNATEKNKKRKSKKPFEELRRDSNAANGDSPMPDSSNIKHLGEIHDEEEEGANGVGGVTENWSDQQTIKVKVHTAYVIGKFLGDENEKLVGKFFACAGLFSSWRH